MLVVGSVPVEQDRESQGMLDHRLNLPPEKPKVGDVMRVPAAHEGLGDRDHGPTVSNPLLGVWACSWAFLALDRRVGRPRSL